MNKSLIEWTDYSWPVVTGCDKVSEGCKNCYAGRIATTRLKHLPQYKDGFFGNVLMHPDRLMRPYKMKKPKMIFPCSMADLFHPDVHLDFIDNVFNTMEWSNWHVFQVLTKRPERMIEYMHYSRAEFKKIHQYEEHKTITTSNVWLGVSVENQKTADDRIPQLKQLPVVVRWLSVEPLIERVSLMEHLEDGAISWVVVGGESGPGARPMRWQWADQIQKECKAAKVPFYMKQGSQTPDWEQYKNFSSWPPDLQRREYPVYRAD